MSVVSAPPNVAASADATAACDDETSTSNLSSAPTQVCRIGFSAHGVSKDSIARGLTVPVKTNLREALDGPAVIEKISLLSAHSDLDVPCQISLKLFNKGSKAALNIDNKHGWPLFECKKSGYVPLLATNPCEQLRCYKPVALYEPGASLTDRFISTYGNLTADKVRSSVVDLPNEPFSLVDTSSIVSRVIETNWDQLGLSAAQMPTAFDGRYMRVADTVVSHVCNELSEQVLGKIPLSNLNKVQAHLTVPQDRASALDGDALYSISGEMQLHYRQPTQASDVDT